MRVAIAVCALLTFVAADSARADGDPDWVPVTIDGRESRAQVVASSIDPESGSRTDLIEVGGFVLTRGPEARLRLRTEPGRLWLAGEDGKESLVAAVATTRPEGDAPRVPPDGASAEPDTIAGLPEAQVAGLRGIRVIGPYAQARAILAKTSPATTFFRLLEADSETLAALPQDARYLGISWGAASRVADVSSLAGLTELRVLLAEGAWLSDLSFVLAMPALELLDLRGPQVVDLTPLSDHTALREIHADYAGARVLPGGALPALRLLRILGAPVEAEAVADFRKTYPNCEVVHRYEDVLRRVVASADRVRVRKGGTCHTTGNEPTHWESFAARDQAEVLELFRFEDPPRERPRGGVSCGCCGDPTFEWWSGDVRLVMIGFHHSRRLRWPGGPWVGDYALTQEVGDRLCEWLAGHGAPGPMFELASERRRSEAGRRREATHAALLPDGGRDALYEASDASARVALLRGWFPVDREAILVFLRLISASRGTGSSDPVSAAAAGALWALRERLPEVLPDALAQPEAALGLGYWLLPLFERPSPAKEILSSQFLPAATRLLVDADADVRGDAIRLLGRSRHPEAVMLLRSLLSGQVLVDPSSSGAEPAAETPRNVRAAVYALVHQRDLESVARMREIAAGWSPDERQDLERELRELEGPREDGQDSR